MVNQIVEQRSVEDRRGIEFLSGNGRADDGKDSRADYGADAERGQRPRSQSLL